MTWKRAWTGLVCVCLSLLLFESVLAQERTQRKRHGWQGPPIGSVVEDFELPLVDGGTFKLSDQRGRILAIEMGACTWPPYLKKIPAMDKIAADFKDKGVDFYNVYTREPHPGEDYSKRDGDKRFDFTAKKSTKTYEERQAHALEMITKFGNNRPIMIDRIGKDCVQNDLGGGAPNSLALIDREGKLVLWQNWSDAKELRAKLEEMTSQ